MVVRANFAGRSDRFLNNVAFAHESAYFPISGLGQFFDDHHRDLIDQRLNRYKRFWRFYRGEHFPNQGENAKTSERLVVNFCGPVVDISIDWLVGKPWRNDAPPGHEEVATILDKVYARSKKDRLSYLMAQHGSITGDVFLYHHWFPFNRKLTADERKGNFEVGDIIGQLSVTPINPKYVYPLHDPITEELIEALIQYPDYPVSLKNEPIVVRSIHLQKDRITVFENEQQIYSVENFIGEIPLVHVRNHVDAASFYGQSDLEHVSGPNQIYDAVIQDLQEIINYHAAPVTLVYGQRVGDSLQRGTNKVWSGFSKDAKVENLEMNTDLKAVQDHLDRLESVILKLSGTPLATLGGMEVSDTSRAALEILFMPLVMKTRRKQIFYGQGLIESNRILLLMMEKVFGWKWYEKNSIPEEDRYLTMIEFADALPRDDQKFMETVNRQIELGLQSRAGALRELGVDDVQAKALEILSDRREDHLTDIELARASADAKYIPNLLALSQGSLSLSTGLEDFFATMNVDIEKALQLSASPIIQEEQEAELEALRSEVERLESVQQTGPEPSGGGGGGSAGRNGT